MFCPDHSVCLYVCVSVYLWKKIIFLIWSLGLSICMSVRVCVCVCVCVCVSVSLSVITFVATWLDIATWCQVRSILSTRRTWKCNTNLDDMFTDWYHMDDLDKITFYIYITFYNLKLVDEFTSHCYTFEKRYYVFHPSLGLSVCVCVCLSVCHHVCGEMAGLSNMVLSEVNTIYTNLKMQH